MARKRISRRIKEAVRDLRRRQTKAEAVLWEAMRNRQIDGKKFLRQHPVIFEFDGKERFLVPDFYCHEAGLVVELDGGIHRKQKDYDAIREEVLTDLGLRVLRFKNKLVLRNLPSVLKKIRSYL
jgi:very-short-patch-repair endonuclease